MLLALTYLSILKIIFCINEEQFIEFTSRIINKTFGEGQCLFYITKDGYDLDLVNKAVNNLDISIVKSSLNHDFDMTCKGYIFILNDYEDIKDIFMTSTRYKLELKADSRALIFRTHQRNKLENYYQLNSNIYGCNIFIMEVYPEYLYEEIPIDLHLISVRNETLLKSWNSTEDFSSNQSDTKKIQTKKWNLGYLNRKIRAVMYNCPPYVSYDEITEKIEGFEVDILREVLKHFPIDYYAYNPNNNTNLNVYHAMIDDIATRRADIMMCTPWLDGRNAETIEASFPYTQHCITFFVPRDHIMEQSTFIFKPVTLALGLGILISGIVIMTTYLLITKVQTTFGITNEYSNSVDVVFQLIRLLTLRHATSGFLTAHNVTRLLVMSWILFSLVMTTIYSSGINAYMTYPPLSGGFHNFKDMVNGNLHWGGLGAGRLGLFIDHSNSVMKNIARLYFKNLTKDEINTKLRRGENVGILVKVLPDRYIHSEVLEELDDVNLDKIKMLPNCVALYLISFYLSKNSPISKFFNRRILRYSEHGIISYWHKKMNNKSGILKRMAIFHKTDIGKLSSFQIVLHMEELQGVFILLSIGWLAAIIAFICEIFYIKYQTNTHKKLSI